MAVLPSVASYIRRSRVQPSATSGTRCNRGPFGVRNQELVKMEKEKAIPQNQDKLGMRAEASEACMRGDAIHIDDS